MSDTSKYIETYCQEAEECLDKIEETVLDIEQNPDNKESINSLFRAIHTIKGSGAMFGFDEIAGFAHHVETLLDKVRDGIVPVTSELINLILTSRDHIKSMLDAEDGGRTVDSETSKRIIAELEKLLPESEKPDKLFELSHGKIIDIDSDDIADDEDEYEELPEKQVETTYRIRFQPDPGVFATGTEPGLLLDELRELGECLVVAQTEGIPSLDILEPEFCYMFWDIILITLKDINDIKDIFIFIEEESLINIRVVEDDFSHADSPSPRLGEILIERGDVPSEIIDEALKRQKRIGELLVEEGKVSGDRVYSALTEQKAIEKRKSTVRSASVRVSSDKLDELINLVGELVVTQAHLSQVVSSLQEFEEVKIVNPLELLERFSGELANPVEILERLTDELRDCALNMRMVPIGTIFGKFRRLVRDLSAELGKEIDLVTEGAETELDKTVIERLNDPLVHLVRNSIDHGIQLPQQRELLGKPRRGTIRLNAVHRGANVVITIEDDGKGMDPESIRAKALEKGMIPEDKELSEKDVLSLVFAPGFSTASKVTNVSGRGVGLDVVKREIDSLGGAIQITGKKGQYIQFNMSLPLTLAIIDGLLVDVGSTSFVLPLAQVEECAELTDKLVRKSHGRNMIMIREELIPFVRLRNLFDISGDESDMGHIAIVQADGVRVGIVVDEIIGNVQTVIKSLDKNYRNAEGISGATIMGNGTVALIIDIPGLIRCARKEEAKNLLY
ncbi:MAG: chemotaxis protein CheA [Desulfobacteraceae bacterium]|nr:chemotaxis protein CheA [Desulfobacteraceae bacterium]